MIQQFLQEFGYFALFLGTFFEGETILVLAGFLAFRGYMDLKLVMIVAFLIFWARFTYPRFREDQLQRLAWTVLIPISLANILVTTILKVAF